MEWDDVTQTATSQPAVVVKRSMLPWALFVGTAVLFAVTTALLVKRAGEAQAQANEAYVAKKRAESDAEELRAKLTGQQETSAQLETQVRAVSAERDALRAEVEALREKVLISEDSTPVVTQPVKKTVKKKTTKKSTRKKKTRKRSRRR